MTDHGYRILLFKGKGIISRLIGWQTRSDYTHVALLCPTGDVIEAWEGDGKTLWRNNGVRVRLLDHQGDIDSFDVPSATLQTWQKVETFMRSQVGHPYDYRSVFKFITRRTATDDETWFCSEILFTAFRLAFFRLLRRIKAYQVHPGHIGISPSLKRRCLPLWLQYLRE